MSETNILDELAEPLLNERSQAVETPQESVNRLAKLSQVDYGLVRKAEATRLGFGVTELGKMVKEAQQGISADSYKLFTASNVTRGGISLLNDDGSKKSQSTLLIEIGHQNKLFHDANKDAYAEVTQGGVNATYKIRSRDYKEYLSHKFYLLADKGANSTAISDAIATLEASAKYNGNKITVAIRTHYSGENIFIDVGCEKRKIIAVNISGWAYVSDAPIKFIRKNGMTELPEPASNGNIELLKKYINVPDSEFPLVYGWIFCAIAGVKPYPILILQGEQGTGKSTTSRVIRSLVDPSTVPLRSPPKDPKDLLVSAANNHAVVMDNLSGIDAVIADCLCRLSTGGGHDVRALFTDDEQYLIELQKPVLCNGIDDIATRPDLAHRSCILNLPVITDKNRLSEDEFWKAFDADKALIMGAILNAISSGLKHRAEIILPEKPRMADVAQWVTACERELGLEGEFLTAHKDNQLHAVELGIEASPVGNALMTLMTDRVIWDGKPTILYDALTDIAGHRMTNSRAWPLSVKGLNNIIQRLKPSFRALGIDIDKKYSGSREYTIKNNQVGKVGFYPPKAPYPPDITDIKGCDEGGYKTQVPDVSAKPPSIADSISKRPIPSQEETGAVSVRADGADKKPPIQSNKKNNSESEEF